MRNGLGLRVRVDLTILIVKPSCGSVVVSFWPVGWSRTRQASCEFEYRTKKIRAYAKLHKPFCYLDPGLVGGGQASERGQEITGRLTLQEGNTDICGIPKSR